MKQSELLKMIEKAQEYFRSPIAGNFFPLFKKFPKSCCGISSKCFAKYLFEEMGIKNVALIAGGTRKEFTESHAWLMVDDYLVDLTKLQFDDYDGSSGWYAQWQGAARYEPPQCFAFDPENDICKEYEAFKAHMLRG